MSASSAARRRTDTIPAAAPDLAPGAEAQAQPQAGRTGGAQVYHYRYGRIDPNQQLAAELALPVLELDEVALATDVLDHAIVSRKGSALVGPKGVGKSMAMRVAVRRCREAEREQVSERRGAAKRAVVIGPLMSPRTADPIELLGVIYRGLTGSELEVRRQGRRVNGSELRREVVEELLQANVAAVVFDEAEKLSDEGLQEIRDLIATAEEESVARYVTGADGQELFRAAGVGVVFVGTLNFGLRLDASSEAGQRWARVQPIGLLEAEQVAEVYRCYLPCVARESEARGDRAWVAFVRRHIAARAIPIRFVENHVREYVRRWGNEDPAIRTVGDVPFAEEPFLGIWAEVYPKGWSTTDER